ncbi:DUF11 domain-containing protein [Streptomyces arenae]|nr:DUF11 domain-containing protein [Streptomyces arenae]
MLPKPSLRIRKSATPVVPKPGEVVTYTVRGTNTSADADYSGARFTDDFSGVLDDATWNDDATATTGTVAFAAPTLTWTGDLAKGAEATIRYSVTVTNNGDQKLRNAVTATGSNCEADSTDPDCRTELPTPRLEIEKRSAFAVALPGGKTTYTVTIRNTGSADATNSSFTDDLGGVLDDAVYNGDGTADSGTITYRRPRLQWRGTVPAGTSVTVTYSVTVTKRGAKKGGDKKLRNAVTTSTRGGNCVTGTEPGCTTTTEVTSPVLPPTGNDTAWWASGLAALLALTGGLMVGLARRHRR